MRFANFGNAYKHCSPDTSFGIWDNAQRATVGFTKERPHLIHDMLTDMQTCNKNSVPYASSGVYLNDISRSSKFLKSHDIWQKEMYAELRGKVKGYWLLWKEAVTNVVNGHTDICNAHNTRWHRCFQLSTDNGNRNCWPNWSVKALLFL